jgi:hypothetical protein
MQGFFGFNPDSLALVAFTTCLSLQCGGTLLLGLTIGLGIITSCIILAQY